MLFNFVSWSESSKNQIQPENVLHTQFSGGEILQLLIQQYFQLVFGFRRKQCSKCHVCGCTNTFVNTEELQYYVDLTFDNTDVEKKTISKKFADLYEQFLTRFVDKPMSCTRCNAVTTHNVLQNTLPTAEKNMTSLLITIERTTYTRNILNQYITRKCETDVTDILSTITLPAVDTDSYPSGKKFALQAWGVHIGNNVNSGHWIYYKKLGGNTIEVNDYAVKQVEHYCNLQQASILLYNIADDGLGDVKKG
jgi:hypothetical protein